MKKFPLLSLLLLLCLFITADRCSDESYKMPESLWGNWVHAHEEDYGNNRVYRHLSYELPPSRGRERFDIRPGGRIFYYGLAAADGNAEAVEGNWVPLNERTISVELPGDKANEFAAELVEVTPNRLVLRKLP